MVDQLEVTRQQWDTWIKALTKGEDSVVARLNRAARAMSDTADEQTESKWGTEDGPSAFGSRYQKYLSEEAKALTQMAANAEKFAKQIEDALKKITGNDDESRASLDKVIDDLNTEISTIDSVYESEKMKYFRANPQAEFSEATKDVGPY
jgi:hypothetical protein